jgi:hypothetical protein
MQPGDLEHFPVRMNREMLQKSFLERVLDDEPEAASPERALVPAVLRNNRRSSAT